MLLHPLLAQADTAPALSPVAEAATLMLVGMTVVFGALVVLLVVIAAVQRLAREAPAERPARPAAPASRPEATPAPGGGLDPRTLAVLTAAATAALGRHAVVTGARVTHLAAPGRGMEPWSQAGRRSIMTSHQPHH